MKLLYHNIFYIHELIFSQIICKHTVVTEMVYFTLKSTNISYFTRFTKKRSVASYFFYIAFFLHAFKKLLFLEYRLRKNCPIYIHADRERNLLFMHEKYNNHIDISFFALFNERLSCLNTFSRSVYENKLILFSLISRKCCHLIIV